ncbi:ABC transporter permease [Limnochorda pilosa]|uniref:ABC transporter permease n=2 Tax=Limnochorda pilosa TaxID=1555112 RepID=A0A0K2SLJ0_LIMPI|nr:ABC transporter permease [Limnochorda pilosa]
MEIAWARLRRNRAAMVAGALLVVLHVLAVFAEFVAPYPEATTVRNRLYLPPTKIHFRDESGRLTRPYVYAYKEVNRALHRYEPDPSQGRFPIRFFVEGAPYRLLGILPTNIHLYGVEAPAAIYPLGADLYGRDILSRIWYGGRRTLFVGVIGILISTGIGLVYGAASGYFGGKIDNVMMRIAEIIISIPQFYLLVALSAILPLGMSSTHRFFLVTVIIGFIGWAGLSRVIRGMVLSLRSQEFVEGARASGAGTWRIIRKHIIPNTLSYLIVSMTIQLPGFILAEASLSFIGLGIQEPLSSWGLMLSDGQNLAALSRYPWILAPGFFIAFSVLAWSFLGDGVRDAFDPRHVD